MFSHLHQMASTSFQAHASGDNYGHQDVFAMMQSKETIEKAAETLASVIVQKLSKFLSV